MLGRTPYGADWYVLGSTPGSHAVANDSSYADGLFTCTYMGAAYTPRLLDYGSSKPSAGSIPVMELLARVICDDQKVLDTRHRTWQTATTANTPAITISTIIHTHGRSCWC